jgi:hypothetical protein
MIVTHCKCATIKEEAQAKLYGRRRDDGPNGS